MYPPQTSMIPVHIALARFLEQGGSVFSNYPYWYLGTTPFRYLTGPVLPGLLVLLHRIFSWLSLFQIMFILIGLCWFFGSMGIFILVKALINADQNLSTTEEYRAGADKCQSCRFGILSAFFYLFGPITPFLFPFSDGLSLISFSIIPWVLWRHVKFLTEKNQRKQRINEVLLSILIAFVILLDTSIIPSMILGMIAVLLAVSGWKKIEKKIKPSLLIIFYSLLLTTIWYSPKYWWQILLAPSFAGKPFISVVGQIGQLLPLSLAIVLAIASAKKIRFKQLTINNQQLAMRFSFFYLFIFVFLTLMRFIADPDFWMDWSAYGMEMQMGLGIGLGLVVHQVQSSKFKVQSCSSKLKVFSFYSLLITVYCLLFTVIFKNRVLGTFQQDITESVEYKIGQKLSELVESEEKVFLSGSTVFWLNAFFDIPQVRGGNDKVSVYPDWRKAAWEIREGQDAKNAKEWLKTLNISYLVVHTQESEEFYHDFKYPEKFEELEGLEKAYDKNGDKIYRVSSK